MTFNKNQNKPILLILLLLIMAYNPLAFSQAQQKPNILFIAVDDLKPNIGCFGDSLAITPQLDAIAAKGMVFTKTYCQQAVCAPSRASLLAGRYPDQTQVWDLETMMRDKNPDILTLPQHFKQNGYVSAGVGKIFDNRSVDNGQDAVSWNNYGNPYQNQLYNAATGKPSYYYANPSAKDTIAKLEAEAVKLGIDKSTYVKEKFWPSTEMADVPFDAYVDGAIAKEGINLMNQLKTTGKPFFLAVGFQRPHLPFNAPKEFWDLHNREKFSLAKFQSVSTNSPSVAYHNSEELRSYTDIPKTGNISSVKQLELIHAYYAATSYIDFLIGKLTTRLHELGLAGNTIIVVWGDHGWHLGDHNLWCKHSNFEEATRSPLIISYPGQPNAGKKYTHPTEFVDIATTLCELSGLNVPLDFEGESLVPAFNFPEIPIKEGALSQYPRNQYMGYSLRTTRYRYTKWVNKTDGKHYAAELYDYETDPLETINRAGKPDYSTIESTLDAIVQTRIEIPSTQNKINFRINGVNGENDTIRTGNSKIIFDNQQNYASTNGDLLVTHVNGNYSYSVENKGFHPVKGQINITSDTIIRLTLQPEVYNVTFKITGEWNAQHLPNAKVYLGNQTKTSLNDGSVSFGNVDYNAYNIKVQLENGFTQIFENIEIFSDTSLVLQVKEPTFSIQFKVVNQYSGKGIFETDVILGRLADKTASDGTATLKVTAGSHLLETLHPKYAAYSKQLKISADTFINVALLPAFSQLKFKLSENLVPVNNANVAILNEIQLSNNLGSAFFNDYKAFTSYSYLIEKTGYNPIQGSLFLINDTTVYIEMVKTPLAIEDIGKAGSLKIWPNPVKNVLHFQSPENVTNGFAKIFDVSGNAVLSVTLKESGKQEIPVKNLSAGTYMLKIISADGQSGKLFLKKE